MNLISLKTMAGALACLLMVPAVVAVEPLPPVGGGMTFAEAWMPTHLETKSKLLDGLEFYAGQVAGNSPVAAKNKKGEEKGAKKKGSKKGKGMEGKTLVGQFTWLMPLDDAIKTLPTGFDRATEEKINWDCFPRDSLLLEGFHKDYFEDRGQLFDWLYLVVDRERRLVGVQFVATNPKKLEWMRKRQVEEREPYYDFIKMKNNASTTQHVSYQILHPEDSMPLIHLALVKNPPSLKVLEDVHWYLAPPFARALLDVVAFQRRWAAGNK